MVNVDALPQCRPRCNIRMVAALVAQSARLARQYLAKFACEMGSSKRLGKYFFHTRRRGFKIFTA